MDTAGIETQKYYIKESGRPWYWAILAFSIFGFISSFFYNSFIQLIINIDLNLYPYANIGCALFSSVISVVVFLAFARNCTVRIFSVLFVVLAFTQIAGFAYSVITSLATYSLFKDPEVPRNNVILNIIGPVLLILNYGIVLACYIVFTLHKKSEILLKVSALLQAIFLICEVVYMIIGPSLIRSISGDSTFSFVKAEMIMRYIGYIDGFIQLLLGTFFYTALTFSKMKPSKAITPPSEVESATQSEATPYE